MFVLRRQPSSDRDLTRHQSTVNSDRFFLILKGMFMRINSAELIEGHSILAVRNALRRCGLWFDVEDLADAMQIDLTVAGVLVSHLQERRWLEQCPNGGLEVTLDGMGFLNASGSRPINRATAIGQVAKIRDRASNFVSTYPEWPLCLERIAVFGSYLSNVEKLGDVDIALKLTRISSRMSDDAIGRALQIAEKAGYRCDSIFERAGGFLTHFIASNLKAGLRSVSLHDWSDIEALGCEYEVIWVNTCG
ncbi:hypothetical protein [Duganella qianjiadongensis]|uniref:Polymerase nucleotidyl transferase domain-containing protein n=1 Tax=Duganella qianjiadongensis TaxID=2692176 RepID=A0ABW9VN52_9BURK|nr:hypothetical protein [Duganella qianjiadongensis]MYM40917.1 hypothetical protein [Duganella qianjiadongensis]